MMTAKTPQTVQLRHEQLDGSWHVDWMLDLDPQAEADLVTFRLSRRIDELEAGESLPAERIADHRRAYLTYEGPISGNRGHVERLSAGRIEAMQCQGDHWAFLLVWHDGAAVTRVQRIRLIRRGGTQWQVESLARAVR